MVRSLNLEASMNSFYYKEFIKSNCCESFVTIIAGSKIIFRDQDPRNSWRGYFDLQLVLPLILINWGSSFKGLRMEIKSFNNMRMCDAHPQYPTLFLT